MHVPDVIEHVHLRLRLRDDSAVGYVDSGGVRELPHGHVEERLCAPSPAPRDRARGGVQLRLRDLHFIILA